jgi:predicted RNA-binding protein with PIN domain
MGATFSSPQEEDSRMVLRGRAPLRQLRSYGTQLTAYTHGRGRLSCEPDGYAPCQNAAEVIAQYGYDPRRDLEHTPDSVFCSHGAGVSVPWDEVESYMHLEGLSLASPSEPDQQYQLRRGPLSLDDRELQAIFAREFGPSRSAWRPPQVSGKEIEPVSIPQEPRRNVLIVDGYNVIFAWDELRTLSQENLDTARQRLLDILCNYSGYLHLETVVVFDAYRVRGHKGETSDYHNLHVVYTREGESGDLYIEKLVGEIGKNDNVRVVTSDSLIQLSVMRSGVLRMSSRELFDDVVRVQKLIDEEIETLGKKTARIRPLGKLSLL